MPLKLERSGGLQVRLWNAEQPDNFWLEEGTDLMFEIGRPHGWQIGIKMAVNILKETLTRPEYAEHPAISGLRPYLGAMVLSQQAGAPFNHSPVWLRSGKWEDFQAVYNGAAGANDIEFLNERVDPQDFVLMAHHVMTRMPLKQESELGGQHDPRLALVYDLRRET